jgi:hypothetical protein
MCVTLKDFWIVWVGQQDSCYRSLYVIECSLIDHIPEVGHPMVPLIWLLGQPLLRWEWWAIIPPSPVVTIVFYHAMEVSCYHSSRAVKSRLCLRLLLWGLLLVSTSRYSVEVRSMSNLSALTCKSASQSCLRIHLGCLPGLLEQSIWSPRLPQEMQRRSSGWAHTSFGIPLAPTIWLSRRTCCFHL